MATSDQRQWYFQAKIDGSGLIDEGGREEKREEIKREQSEWIGERERERERERVKYKRSEYKNNKFFRT